MPADPKTAQLTVRGLDPGVLERLKARARRNGRSMEEEIRQVLTAAAGGSRAELAAGMAALREAIGDQGFDSLTMTDAARAERDKPRVKKK